MNKILIIDDDPIHQRIAQIMIERHRLFDTCISYTEANKALKFFSDNLENELELPDVVLLYLNMSGMSGWEFLNFSDQIKNKIINEVKVIIVSSSIDQEDKKRAEVYSFVSRFITKPLSPDLIKNAC